MSETAMQIPYAKFYVWILQQFLIEQLSPFSEDLSNLSKKMLYHFAIRNANLNMH